MLNAAFVAIGCGLSAATAWGLADFWSAKAARSIGPAAATIAVNIVSATAFLLYFLAVQPAGGGGVALWYAMTAGLMLGLGQITLFQGLNAGPVSVVVPLTSAYPLITTIVVMLVFHMSVSLGQSAGIGMVMLGVFAASELFGVQGAELRTRRGPLFAIATAIFWGIGYALLAEALKSVGWQQASLVQLATMAITCLFLAPIIKGEEKLLGRESMGLFLNWSVVGAGLAQMLGLVLISIGIERNVILAPTVTALSACYPVLTVILALIYLKERLKPVSLMGVGATIVGVVIITLN